ncbi:hypothetical protein [Microbacterium jiangjiandongii]|uniref:hypothetical protein n=1 Tax=Microbacterium jiangjiandongii TaxID=3049071 RepID=UPI00214CD4D2|nr:hypothetical protein [Microbacterium sp. zg.Y843]MCR2815019.1 hypothetical protein [Microbacterium sp. zg.Y843]
MAILAERTEAADKANLHLLLNANLRAIVTLIHDLVVEKAAVEAGRRYSTGASEWDGRIGGSPTTSTTISCPGSGCTGVSTGELLAQSPGPPLPIPGFEEVGGNGLGAGEILARLDEPAIFGVSGRMSPHDPCLALRGELERMLQHVEQLVVVGFSFWDAHVTAPIRRWLALDERRRITIVDRFFVASESPIRVLVVALCRHCRIDGEATIGGPAPYRSHAGAHCHGGREPR